jgi:hypothetical protein
MIYALLGMCCDDLTQADLLPDYALSWEELSQRLHQWLFGKHASAEDMVDLEVAVIRSRGYIFGKISSISGNLTEGKLEAITTLIACRRSTGSSLWTLQMSADPVCDGDLVCLLNGNSSLMIVRVRGNYFMGQKSCISF